MGIANCTVNQDYALATSGAMLFTPELQHRIDRQELVCRVSVFDLWARSGIPPVPYFSPAYANKEYKIQITGGMGAFPKTKHTSTKHCIAQRLWTRYPAWRYYGVDREQSDRLHRWQVSYSCQMWVKLVSPIIIILEVLSTPNRITYLLIHY